MFLPKTNRMAAQYSNQNNFSGTRYFGNFC